MASLFDYLKQTQRFLREGKQDLLNPEDLIGYINRARRDTYRHSADFRARVNGCPYHEPSN